MTLANGNPRRNKGGRAEREAVNWLRAHGWPDARRYMAGDGRQPGDLDALPGVVIDVKARATWRPNEWLTQAEGEAASSGRLPVVWARLTGQTDPGRWVVMLRASDFFEMMRSGK